MVDAMLSADQVAEMRERVNLATGRDPTCGNQQAWAAHHVIEHDADLLLTQDAGWRALVGALLREWDLLARLYSDGDVLAIDGRAWDVVRQAQAALDGPPPPTREPSP